MDNKKVFIEFLKWLLIAVLVFLTIIPNAEVWNVAHAGMTDGFHVVVSILDFIAEAVLVWIFGAKVLFKKKDS